MPAGRANMRQVRFDASVTAAVRAEAKRQDRLSADAREASRAKARDKIHALERLIQSDRLDGEERRIAITMRATYRQALGLTTDLHVLDCPTTLPAAPPPKE